MTDDHPDSAGQSAQTPPTARVPPLALVLVPSLAAIAMIVAVIVNASISPAQGSASAIRLSGVAGEHYLWRPVAIGGGGFVTGLSSDAAGRTLVARTDVHGAYRWSATANRWVQLATATAMPEADRVQAGMNEGAYEVAVAPGDPARLYMAIKGRVYRSGDGGAHWSVPVGPPFPLHFDPNSEFRLYGPFIAVGPTNPDLVMFGTPEDGLWRSSDGGKSWGRVDSVPAGADLRPAPGVQSPGIAAWFGPASRGRPSLYAASPGHGVFVSVDDGLTFKPLGAPAAPRPLTIIQARMAADGRLFAIEQETQKAWVFDGAWRELTSAPGMRPARFAGIAADPRSPTVFVTDEGGQAWCSPDGGRHWSSPYRDAVPGKGEPPWLALNNQSYLASGPIAFDSRVPGRLWLASGVGPYVADIGAGCPWRLHWISQVRGIEELVASDVIQRPGAPAMFGALDFGIHVKPRLDEYSTSFGPKPRLLIAAQQIEWTLADPNFFVTNASDTRVGCCAADGDAVLAGTSRDGGHTWRKFASLPTPPGTRPDDPWRMAFGTIAVSSRDVGNIVWAPALDRSPFYTLDGGVSWHRVVLPGEVLPDTGSFPHIFGARRTLAADRVLPGTFYLVHSGGGANAALTGLWRTGDGGKSWARVFAGEIAPNSGLAAKLKAVPGKAGHLFFTSSVGFGADTRLRRSLDGGRTWQALAAFDHVDDVAFGKAAAGASYPAIFVSARHGGRYGIWRSTDDAASWGQVAAFPIGRLDQVSVIEGDKDVFGRVYVGYVGSGWLYGEPASCNARPPRGDDDRECWAVARLEAR